MQSNRLTEKPNGHLNEDRTVEAKASKNVKLLATRQKVRLFILFVLAITFPITVDYFSVVIPIPATKEGVLAISSVFWLLWFITAFYFGRAGCGYVCPLGALQETKDRMWPKRLPKIRNLKIVKYVTFDWHRSLTIAF